MNVASPSASVVAASVATGVPSDVVTASVMGESAKRPDTVTTRFVQSKPSASAISSCSTCFKKERFLNSIRCVALVEISWRPTSSVTRLRPTTVVVSERSKSVLMSTVQRVQSLSLASGNEKIRVFSLERSFAWITGGVPLVTLMRASKERRQVPLPRRRKPSVMSQYIPALARLSRTR